MNNSALSTTKNYNIAFELFSIACSLLNWVLFSSIHTANTGIIGPASRAMRTINSSNIAQPGRPVLDV